jgi:class 3 adenylate cyclase/putative methionine-R-sulfoxide reductase with GAF domain
MEGPPREQSHMQNPLYNSRVLKIYVEYIRKFHPGIDVDEILRFAWIRNYELEDQGHWFSQWQVDRFHSRLMQKSGDSKISRKVGQFAASSQATGALKNYTLGFITPAAAYWVFEKIAPHMTRAMTFKSKKLGSYKFEITARPKHGVVLQPYQCENMIGQLEALSKLFTGKFSRVDHPECIHKQGECCKYVVTIEKTPTFIWRTLRPFIILPTFAVCAALHFVMPSLSWSALTLLFISFLLGASYYFERLERVELGRNVESQREAVETLLDQINIRYNDTQLIKEIGQATSMLLEIDSLLHSVIHAIENRLDYDRGGIWLANKEKTRLVYRAGFGYSQELGEILRKTDFHLDKAESKGVAVMAFREQKPYLVNDIQEIERNITTRSLDFIKKLGTQSFICVPIVFERESLGVLFVDNMKSKRSLGQSDMSLLSGIATQIAISIRNAISYERIEESREREQSLRRLFERYVPSPVIKRYIDSGEGDLFHGEESFVTALFLDIRGFTSSSESMEAKDVVSFLNNYFEKCSEIVTQESGHINKYTGDGFFAVFGAPEPLPNHVSFAFNAACRLLDMSKSFILEGKPMMIGIGVHTGRAIIGNIGCRIKIEYTAIGDTVNTAARLQEITKYFQNFPIIMSRAVWDVLVTHPLHPKVINLGVQRVRGKKEKLEAFGFNPMIDRTSVGDSTKIEMIPLQSIKGA